MARSTREAEKNAQRLLDATNNVTAYKVLFEALHNTPRSDVAQIRSIALTIAKITGYSLDEILLISAGFTVGFEQGYYNG